MFGFPCQYGGDAVRIYEEEVYGGGGGEKEEKEEEDLV